MTQPITTRRGKLSWWRALFAKPEIEAVGPRETRKLPPIDELVAKAGREPSQEP